MEILPWRFQEEVLAGDIVLRIRIPPASHPKLKAPDRLHLPVIGAVEIGLRSANMGVAHQRLNRPEIIPFIQKGSGEGMPDHMGMNPLADLSSPGPPPSDVNSESS